MNQIISDELERETGIYFTWFDYGQISEVVFKSEQDYLMFLLRWS